MLWLGKNRLNWDKLVDFAFRFKSQSMIQRLGFLLDFLEIEIPIGERQKLTSRVEKNSCYLGRPRKWGKGGKYSRFWQIVANIPESELLAEIKIT